MAISHFFLKFAKILAAQGAPPVSTTTVARRKKLKSVGFKIFLSMHVWVVGFTNR